MKGEFAMKKAFTLVEMLFVMTIIMILLLLVIPQVTKKSEAVKDKGCEALIDVIDAQIQLYELCEGYLPHSISELIQKGYIEEKQSRCPNGQRIEISGGQAYCE